MKTISWASYRPLVLENGCPKCVQQQLGKGRPPPGGAFEREWAALQLCSYLRDWGARNLNFNNLQYRGFGQSPPPGSPRE